MALVLVVDDEPDIRDVIRINLEAAGYRVVLANNGDEAVAALHREPIDAVFLDVLMPGRDGWDVLAHVKGACDGCLDDVPVVMVSALTQAEDRLRGAIEGAVRYLTKPFDPADLPRVLGELLGPEAPTERETRAENRRRALESLARLEARGRDDGAGEGPRVHLTRLERTPRAAASSTRGTPAEEAVTRLASLTAHQRELVKMLSDTAAVGDLAERLGTSRSNVYASLRRIARRLGLRDTAELLRLARAGVLAPRRGPGR